MKVLRINKTYKLLFSFIMFFSSLFTVINAQGAGGIEGAVIDESTKQPLVGANILVVNTTLGTTTDLEGKFSLNKIPPGSYNLEIRFIGYKSSMKSDVIVRPDRMTFVNVELVESPVEVEDVVVSGSYFSEKESQPVSAVSLSYEEIRRAPGSAGDISRILNAMPGVSRQTDQFNDLLVRGGSPVENGYYLDNIPIPNINHFPVLGSASGAIGILNTDFINNVDFFTGGFSPIYGDRLSSVMDISYREGNKENIYHQLDFNLAGFGGQAEGSVFDGKGSWLISAKRSYLDLIQDAIQTEGETPRFGDVQGKFTYDLDKNNKLTLLFIHAPSSREDERKAAEEDGRYFYTKKYEAFQNTVGTNWRYLWSNNGYSNTSVTFNRTSGDSENRFIQDDKIMASNDYSENLITLRNVSFYKFNKTYKVDFGFELKRETTNYNYYFAEDIGIGGELVPTLKLEENLDNTKAGFFANLILQPIASVTTTIGFRTDYSDINESLTFSPRLSLSWKFNERFSVSASGGIFYQSVPTFLISQNQSNRKLNNLKSTHYILGFDYMVTADTKFTIELYSKEYEDFPMSPLFPYLFVADEGTNYTSYQNYGELQSTGESYARGIDLLLQKKLAEDFYGIVSASYFRSRYKDYNGIWRDRKFDNKFLFSILGGYKPNDLWEFSVRWNYSGGAPFTPFDMTKSREANKEIYDLSKINGERMPAYHSLNFRIDRRFNFPNSSIVAYISLWNLYNRKNVSLYLWDRNKNEVRTLYQWSLLPILGVEYEL